jgi:hypothetical protein
VPVRAFFVVAYHENPSVAKPTMMFDPKKCAELTPLAWYPPR